jgi:hypothetical protein
LRIYYIEAVKMEDLMMAIFEAMSRTGWGTRPIMIVYEIGNRSFYSSRNEPLAKKVWFPEEGKPVGSSHPIKIRGQPL